MDRRTRLCSTSSRPPTSVYRESVVKMSADELYMIYTTWQEGGNEYERSKAAILKELGLNAFGGITSIQVGALQG